MLRQLNFKGVYKSDEDNILEDFYMPALTTARSYDRAVGFFSAATISYAAQAISTFVRQDGHMRLVLGAFADAEDIDAVTKGLEARALSERVGAELLGQIDRVDDALFRNRFEALAWLVAHGRLEVKIALRQTGMYHDKIGIITDAQGDSVVFSGSANESLHALLPTHNYESIDVFPSWRPELDAYHRPHRESFERLWANKSRNTAVLDIPTAVRERLLSVAERVEMPLDPDRELAIARRIAAQESDHLRDGPRVPATVGGVPFAIRNHQRDALKAWQHEGNYRGILDLATGAGKTITAAYAITQMTKAIPGLTVVIAVPYQNLADQWCDNLELFNIRPLRCYVSKASWLTQLQSLIMDIEVGVAPFTAIVVVNRTLKTPEFQELIGRIPGDRFLWIGDECHHHGSQTFATALPAQAKYRLGLSATPEHYLDVARNARLEAFYGKVVFSYSLAEAIQDEVLTPYEYFPHLVELTSNEADEFVALSAEIGRLTAREGNAEPSIGLKALMMKRARVIASARNKIPALRGVLSGHVPEAHTLFYCGDGQVEADDADDDADDDDPEFSGRQIEVVSEHLHDMGWTLSRFTSREPRKERDRILANFRIGLVDAMVAIKCLDEGIDVPACRTAYILASSRDPRQFIQRRGRILRRSPGKEVATIHDFVVVLPEGSGDGEGYARKLIASELRRVAEFAGLSRNRTHAYSTLRHVLVAYGLEHVL